MVVFAKTSEPVFVASAQVGIARHGTPFLTGSFVWGGRGMLLEASAVLLQRVRASPELPPRTDGSGLGTSRQAVRWAMLVYILSSLLSSPLRGNVAVGPLKEFDRIYPILTGRLWSPRMSEHQRLGRSCR